ncbi:MAG: BREX-1 system adenine-specific DNA-methyltransferase PglX [Clostridia bacterium]|nr:BREX-1 system adenine-specific DNA-methyltransferase PglX [Clostridia bacterium]
MKARQYDRRIFSRNIQPHVYSIVESNGITTAPLHDMGLELTEEEYDEAVKQTIRLIDEMNDAKEYGSILNITPCDWDLLRRFAVPRCVSEGQITLDIHGEQEASARLQEIINVAEALVQKYHAVVTNPPYMGSSGMSAKLLNFVKKYYADSKADLYACFIEKCNSLTNRSYFQAMITQHSWMFLSSFEQLRSKLLHDNVVNMAHLGAHAFEEIGGEVVQTTSFVIRKQFIKNITGVYSWLIEPTTQTGKEELFLKHTSQYNTKQDVFHEIAGSPFAYWISDHIIEIFANNPVIDSVAKPRQGLATGDNNKMLRLWSEVDFNQVSLHSQSLEDLHKDGGKRYIPYNKGGSFRKWYGNIEYLIKFDKPSYDYLLTVGNHLPSRELYFKESITWSKVTSGGLSMRYVPVGSAFDVAGCSIFSNTDLLYLLALCNSSIMQVLIRTLSQTMNYEVGTIKSMPVIIDKDRRTVIERLVDSCIAISKEDWDSFETSWDFKCHPLVKNCLYTKQFHHCEKENPETSIQSAYMMWCATTERRFQQLKSNEEELNRIFIDIYGLQNEVIADVDDKNVTVRKADLVRDIRSLISYAVGCMFGRYSLDCEGLAYAGGDWDTSKYLSFPADKDNIIPICDDDYFDDDITGRFIKWVEIVYGPQTLEENLRFIADALGGKGSPRDVIRNYFLNDFYSDHLKIYQKRPIYWLFDSGKKNGFKALIYMHRYQPDTIARMRTDYVHEQQSRYRTAIADLEQRINSASTGDRVKLNKQLQKLQDQANEIRVYEEKIHHLADQMIRIDLDDGVKVNYAKFEDVLAKIK